MPVPQERLTSVTYQGVATQTKYTFHFDYLNKKFVKVLLTDSLYGTEQELTQNIDYTVYQKEITLNTPTNKIIKIYRKTDTLPTVSWEEGSVLRATDLTLQDTQVYHLIEESVEGNKTNSEMLNDAIHLVNDVKASEANVTNTINQAVADAVSATIAIVNNAQLSEGKAKTSELNAKTSENNAKASELKAQTYATESNSVIGLENHIAKGLKITGTNGFNVDISAGVIVVNETRKAINAQTKTLDPIKFLRDFVVL